VPLKGQSERRCSTPSYQATGGAVRLAADVLEEESAVADPLKPIRQNLGIYHPKLGTMIVTAVNDGIFRGSLDWVNNADRADAALLHHGSFRRPPPEIAVNGFLVQTESTKVLVDAGCGISMGPMLGGLTRNLATMGVQPNDISTVLLTHLHPDHAQGLLDDAGNAVFSKTGIVLHADELAFWTSDDELGRAPEERRLHFMQARAAIAAYGERMRTIRGGEVLPGIVAIHEPGHTPGHTGWLLSSEDDALLIWGDIVHLHGIQFARPDVGLTVDVDGPQAIATRQRIMDMAATDRLRIAGMHIDFPAFGHVVRAGKGYAFVPEVWRPTP
jgi:glyoxylase-like metal-dependent hydrolase (beta-lactamase superfamily II)